MQRSYLASQAVAVIYAGGDGTRLWPISTSKSPKQINPLLAKETLLVDTYNRARQFFSDKHIVIVTTKQIYSKVAELVPLPKRNYLIQPDNADTAVATGVTAMYLERYFPDSVAVSFYSDHVISHTRSYIAAMKRGIRIAKKEKNLVTIGTKPTYPSNAFGYIKKGKKIGRSSSYHVDAFVEKPSEERALQFLDEGTYLWNTGLYIWDVHVLLSLYKSKAPQLYKGLVYLRTKMDEPAFSTELSSWYSSLPSMQSFEKVISEHTHDTIVVEAKYAWHDIGNWKTIYELAQKDKKGNAVIFPQDTQLININSHNCLVLAGQKLVSLVGVHDLIVVQTKKELLICHKDEAHNVKLAAKAAHG